MNSNPCPECLDDVFGAFFLGTLDLSFKSHKLIMIIIAFSCTIFVQGISQSVNAAGRKPNHLYILPGGVAEIFTSTPGRHTIVFKNRRGLCKLAIETGAQLIPCYVFGGTDFFNNLATDDGFFASLSRTLRMGVTIFWGPLGLPIPYAPKVRVLHFCWKV